MSFHRNVLVVVLSLALKITAQNPPTPNPLPATPESTRSYAFLYNGTSTVMQTSKAINFTIKTTGKESKLVTSLLLPPANSSKITANVRNDTKLMGVVSTFTVAFTGPMPSSNDGKFSSLSLTFETFLNFSTSYWKISSISVDYGAQVGGKTYVGKEEKLDVDSDPGYTHDNVDQSCERAHSSCAPKFLSWSCDGQLFRSTKFNHATKETASKVEDGGAAAVIVFPGFQYQPFYSATTKFGYNWDCDALIALPVWTSLIITLGLLLIVYWSVNMITSLNTPDKFDDPKGQQLVVPTSD